MSQQVFELNGKFLGFKKTSGVSQAGKAWTSYETYVEIEPAGVSRGGYEYPAEVISLKGMGQGADVVEGYNKGDNVTVSFRISGKVWEKEVDGKKKKTVFNELKFVSMRSVSAPAPSYGGGGNNFATPSPSLPSMPTLPSAFNMNANAGFADTPQTPFPAVPEIKPLDADDDDLPF